VSEEGGGVEVGEVRGGVLRWRNRVEGIEYGSGQKIRRV
jgi:hypothetical protein